MTRLTTLPALLLVLALAACSGVPSLDDKALSTRDLNLEEFFDGRTVAHGQFQDRFGTPKRRFKVDIDGTWDGTTLRLVEDFTYSDNTEEQRIWTLRKTGEDTWEGTAPGVIGTARGEERGDTFNWAYTIDLPVRDGTMRVKFDDWMWLLEDGKLLNRAYMYRLGIYVGDVVIVFERV